MAVVQPAGPAAARSPEASEPRGKSITLFQHPAPVRPNLVVHGIGRQVGAMSRLKASRSNRSELI